MNKYSIKCRKDGKFYYTLTARNGQVICKSQPYASKAGCYNGIESLKAHAHTEVIEEDLKVKEYDIG